MTVYIRLSMSPSCEGSGSGGDVTEATKICTKGPDRRL